MRCASCGSEVPTGARFCASCGAPVDDPEQRRETRKLVTVLFADIVGSTQMGEHLDPEAIRGTLARYFAAIRQIIERHGGTVEKFIGDAVMAVFGVPEVHEDDALRAVRAAAELQTTIATLNADPGATASVVMRVGLNSGEVVASETPSETLVTGDTVNTAARLEQAAAPGEILMGAQTFNMVRDAVRADAIEPLTLKGKERPVAAFRFESLIGAEGRRRNLEARLVGRSDELEQLTRAWEGVRIGQAARMTTLIAPAGVGKSRLVRELVSGVEVDSRVLRGQCLPYGDGITYWPIRQVLYAAVGIDEADSADDARGKIGRAHAALADGDLITSRLSAAFGLSNEPAAQEEIFWAVRRSLEAVATTPVLVVLEDLHWAESSLLDLGEYITDLAAAPLLVLATARPELLEARPGWGSGENANLIRLEPLEASDTDELLDAQAGGSAIPPELRQRILDAAEGNPLFIEEMVAMLREEGRLVERDDGWHAVDGRLAETEVPVSIRALLAARLDRLPAEERLIAQSAAVVGRSFEAAAVAALAPDSVRADLGRRLIALVRKELLRPDRSELTPGDAFRFRHILIRDAAYEALAKGERARLHERFAGWLDQVAADRMAEFEEIVGYHLEQAGRYRRELGEQAEAERLDRAAGERLMAAGQRAARRGDNGAAIRLLTKATDRVEGPRRTEARLDLAVALSGAGDDPAAGALLDDVLREADAAGDDVVTLRVGVRRALLVLGSEDTPGATIRASLEAAIAPLESLGLDRELGLAWLGLGMLEGKDAIAERHAFEQALVYAAKTGDIRLASAAIGNMASALRTGTTPVSEALVALDELMKQGVGGFRAQAGIQAARGGLMGMRGDFDEARRLFGEALSVCDQVRAVNWQVLIAGELAMVELLAGEPRFAFRVLHAADSLVDAGAAGMQGAHQACWGMVYASTGDWAKAIEAAGRAEPAVEPDPELSMRLRRARALALAGSGDVDSARRELDDAIARIRASPLLPDLGMALLDRARIRQAAGDDGWEADAEEARDVFARKEHLVGVRLAEALLSESSQIPG